MGPPSPPRRRGEPAVPAKADVEQEGARQVTRRIRRLSWLGRAFRAGTAVVALGFGLFGPRFLTGTTWDAVHNVYGAAPPIAGTLLTSAIALLIAVPLALGVAIFLSEVAPVWLRRPLTYVIDLSAAVPSVVYGFWAFIVLVPLMKTTVEPGLGSLTGGGFPFSPLMPGADILTASLVLAVMILPTIAAVSRESLRA